MLNNARLSFLPVFLLSGAAFILCIITPWITELFLIPFLRTFFSPDGIIDVSTHTLINEGLYIVGKALIALSFLIAIHALILHRAESLPEKTEFVPPKPSPITPKDMITLSLLLLTAFIVRFPLLGRGLIHDEIYTCFYNINLTRPEQIFLPFSTTNHLGATLLAWLSAKTFGMSEWALRLPSLLFGTGTLLIFWYWIRRNTPAAIALIATALLAVSPIHAFWSTSLRGYSAVVFFSLLSTISYQEQLQQNSRRKTYLLFTCNILGVFFHPFFLLIPLTQFLHLWIITCHKPLLSRATLLPLLKTFTFSFIGIFLILTPLVILSWRTLLKPNHTPFIPTFPLILFNDMNGTSCWPIGILTFLCLLIGARYLHRHTPRLTSFTTYLLILITLPLCVWLMHPRFLYSRFFAFLLPFCLFLFAAGMFALHEQWKKKNRLLGVLPLALIFILFGQWLYSTPRIAVEMNDHGFREAAAFAEKIATKEEPFYAVGEADALFSYYSKRTVMQIKTMKDYTAIITQNKPAVFFTLADMEQSPEHTAIINDLKKYSKIIQIKTINIFLR